jgi:hypothetical protein
VRTGVEREDSQLWRSLRHIYCGRLKSPP